MGSSIRTLGLCDAEERRAWISQRHKGTIDLSIAIVDLNLPQEYVLLRILGKGAFGLVYEATLLNRKTEHFAIKIVPIMSIQYLQ